MTLEQKALEILRALAQAAADAKSITISEDWGFGTATVNDQDGNHTHVGYDSEDKRIALASFVSDLYDLLIEKRGLSWVAKETP